MLQTKSEFTYENDGKKISEIVFSRSNDNTWKYLRRIQTEYDEQGNKILLIQELWNEVSSSWGQGVKDEWLYNENGKLTYSANFNWDAILNQWTGEERNQYVYDDQGHRIEYIYSLWKTADNNFRNYYRYQSNYVNGKLISSVTSYWKNSTQEWITTNISEDEYNEQGQNISSIGYQIVNGDTVPLMKLEWEYQGSANPVSFTNYSFQSEDSTWSVYMREEYGYDSYGDTIVTKRYQNYSEINGLLMQQKTMAEYDEHGNKVMDFYCDYDYTFLGNTVVSIDSSGRRTDFTYNASGKVITEHFIGWDPYNSPMVYKDEYEYNENDKVISHISYMENNPGEWKSLFKEITEYDDHSNILLFTLYEWDETASDWILTDNSQQKQYYYPQEIIDIISHPDSPGISLYPNPASDYVIIQPINQEDPVSASLYNTSGQLILEKDFVGRAYLDLGSLKDGIYNCLITMGKDKVYFRKIVKISR
jgi:YD repeat-containing protein